MTDITCPYCEHDFDLDHDDCPYYQEDHSVEAECPECEKLFVVWSSVHWSHEGHKADCLNGSPHKWSKWREMWKGDTPGTLGKVYEYRKCEDCDKKEEEWHTIVSPSEAREETK